MKEKQCWSGKVIRIMVIMAGMACFCGIVGHLMVKQDSRYMLHSQMYQNTDIILQHMLENVSPAMIPAISHESLQNEHEMQEKQMLSVLLKHLFPVYEYMELYGKEEDLALVKQEVPKSYLENGGEDENSVVATQETATTEQVVSSEVSQQQTKEGKKGEKGHTYSSVYTNAQLQKFSFLKSEFYAIDSMTPVYAKDLNAKTLLRKDLSISKEGEEPKVLLYHTHGSEAFADSRKGKVEDTVIGVGDVLAEELEKTYGIKVFHDREVYDVINGKLDRSQAYNVAGAAVDTWLAKYPPIEANIDLHRAGVAESTHLLTTVDGKPTATIMLFNGMSRIKGKGDITYLPNENLQDNLAFSLQMQLASKEYYDNFTRKIFVRSYRYNLHYKGRSTLIEAGAQTNSVQEVKNAMYPLAKVLNDVLSKE